MSDRQRGDAIRNPTPEERAEVAPLRDAAKQLFGLKGPLLEVVADPDAYLRSARDLVPGGDSTARRVAGTPPILKRPPAPELFPICPAALEVPAEGDRRG